jgi:hypothetical protein
MLQLYILFYTLYQRHPQQEAFGLAILNEGFTKILKITSRVLVARTSFAK